MNFQLRGKPKMQLEQYLDFSQTRKGHDLTINFLNQIISMHGFTKLHKATKNDIVDAVSTIDLMVPFRSTLKENISSNAFITLEEVIEDLSLLQWQECSVKSIETLSSWKEKVTEDDDIFPKSTSSAVSINVESSKLNWKGKAMKAGILAAAATSSTLTVGENAGKMTLKKKRIAMKAGSLAAAAAAASSSSFTVGDKTGELKLKKKRRSDTKAGTLAAVPPSSCLSLGSC